MKLVGDTLDQLVTLLKDAFNAKSLNEVVGRALNEDMFKAWVNPNQSFVGVLRELLPALAEKGLLAILLDAVAVEREALAQPLTVIRDLLGLRTTTTDDQTKAISTVVNDLATQPQFAALRVIVGQSKTLLTELAAKIVLLGAYKHLHDALHDSKAPFKTLLNKCKKIETDEDALNDCLEAMISLGRGETKVKESFDMLPATPPSFRQTESTWVTDFSEAVDLLQDATEFPSVVTAKQGVQALQRIFNRDPSRIDKCITDIAAELDLTGLIKVFDAAATPELAADAPKLDEGRMAVEQLSRQIKTQVEKHTKWQSIDNGFISADEYVKQLADDPSDFDAMWKGLTDDITPLMAVEPTSAWALRIAACITNVNATRGIKDWPN